MAICYLHSMLNYGFWGRALAAGVVVCVAGGAIRPAQSAAQQHIPVLPGARTPRQAQLAAFRSRIQHIVFLIKEPEGMARIWRTLRGRLRVWPLRQW